MMYLCVLTVFLCVWAENVRSDDNWCEVNGLRLSKGETWQEKGKCVEMTCQGNNISSSLGCGLMQVDVASGWTLSKEDLTKSYPTCCPQPIPPSDINYNTPQPPQCVEEGDVYQVGQHKDIPGWCGANICSGNNTWSLLPCGLIDAPEGWTMILEDLSKPYPKCCAHVVPSVELESTPTSTFSIDSILQKEGENNSPDKSQDSVDTQTESPGYWKELQNIQRSGPELSNLELSGLPAEYLVGVDVQAQVLKGDLNTVAQDNSDHWMKADDSLVQNVRSTFPNDQAGLRRLISGSRVTTKVGNFGSSHYNINPKDDNAVPVERSLREGSASKEVVNPEEVSVPDSSASVEVGSLSDSLPVVRIEGDTFQDSTFSGEYGSGENEESQQENSQEDSVSIEDNTDNSEKSALWFGIFK